MDFENNTIIIWFFSMAVMVAAFVILALKTTPQIAIGFIVGVAFFVPVWIILPLLETPNNTIVASGIDVKLGVTAACLFLYCFMPGRTFPMRLVPSDFAMIGLTLIHFTSDLTNTGFSWMIIVRIYGEWFAAYVAGRLAFQSLVFPENLWKTLAIASSILGVCAICESLFRFNVFEAIVGQRPLEGVSRDAARWGIRRAYGPTMHPIYFGGLQLILLAWPVYGMLQALRRKVGLGWLFLPILPVLGICATGSRGPIVSLLFFVIALVFYQVKRSRVPVTIVATLVLIVGSLNFYQIIERLDYWSGESRNAERHKVEVDGKKMAMSSARSRIIMLEVYRIAINRSGLIGYGTVATSGFPINVPISGQEYQTLRQVRFIDNAYVLLTLRFGYTGIVFFLVACIACLWQFYYLTNEVDDKSIRQLCSVLAAGLISIYFLAATVWMPEDFGFPMMWTMGISSGLFRALLISRSKNRALAKLRSL